MTAYEGRIFELKRLAVDTERQMAKVQNRSTAYAAKTMFKSINDPHQCDEYKRLDFICYEEQETTLMCYLTDLVTE
ncbi:MAG: hypothetical protein P4L79_10095 [Legionella sp.]|uniref:hypothetical protein n=1 Tax=Legionella sp. TaxID=459 RepID=UPI0028482FB3|nr:hypothetical protein [Legionella sp.]